MASTIYSRYHDLAAVVIDDRVSLAQRPPALDAEEPDSLLHVVVGGETLDQLAKTYYGREELWWRIADANPRKFPLDWRAGDALVIPPIRTATRTPSR